MKGEMERRSGQLQNVGSSKRPEKGRSVVRPDGSVDNEQLKKEIRRYASDPSLLPPDPGKFATEGSEKFDACRLSDDGKKVLGILEREAGDWEYIPKYVEELGINDLEKGIQELKDMEVVDESDPERLKLKRTWMK